jgi:hypothetical protein
VTPDRWQEIKPVSSAALDCPPAERAAMLTDVCAGATGAGPLDPRGNPADMPPPKEWPDPRASAIGIAECVR